MALNSPVSIRAEGRTSIITLLRPGPLPRVVVCTEEASQIVVTSSAGVGAQAADAFSGAAHRLSAMAAAILLNLFIALMLKAVFLSMHE
ncbi:hypothetical protein [Sodalis ligni]|uniref:hypothetical protein n=1 Tax=Sodalis ligni TaxID=2697027 RepID=UPI001FB57455|nr:hypothetical protein [Sodalis ligni]